MARAGDSDISWSWCAIELSGPLETTILRDALEAVVKHHEILRTVFQRQPGLKTPFQVILEDCGVDWTVVERRESNEPPALDELLALQGTGSLDRGPVLKVLLASFAQDRHWMMLRLPTLCADVFSLAILVSETVRAYGAKLAGHPFTIDAMQYADIVEWQNELLQGEEAAAGREFWREYLRRAQSWQKFQLPFESIPSGPFSFRQSGSSLPAAPLDRFAVERDASVREVLLACWILFLARTSGCAEMCVSCEYDGRNHDELKTALGALAKQLPLAAKLETHDSFIDLLCRVRGQMTEISDWQDCFNCSADQRSLSPFSFSYEEYGAAEQWGGVGFRLVEAEAGGESYTLKLRCERRGAELRLAFHYDASRLSRPAVERWMEQYRTLLEAALAQPEERVSRLALVGEEEKQRLLVEWNRTAAEYPRERCFHELLEAQVELTPERAAVSCQGLTLSYRELNQRANRLAHYLRELGVGPDRRVGLCLERSVDLLVGVVAILKAGGAYVALNAQHPAERLQQQLSGAAALLTEAKWRQQMPAFAGATVSVDEDGENWSERPADNLEPVAQADNLAYVIYTSGSTGTPKGVQVRHRNLVNYAYAVMRKLEWDRAGLQFATVSTLSADLGNTCIYPALLTGGCVHVIPAEMATDSRALGRYFAEHGVDVLKIVPSHLRALLDAGGGREILPRRCLVLGGETLTVDLLERIEALGGGCEVVNHYGPTETTVGSLLLRIKDYEGRGGGGRNIPIGRPLANTRIYVLDGERQVVPEGVEGELYIAGAGVTAGYLEQPEQTAERFVADLVEPGERMYRTGDRVRYGAGGNVEFLGRFDDQVKIRGYRVEPGEVEAVLGQHPGVRQAVVTVRQQPESGEKQLLAYVVHRPESNLTVEELQRYLKARVPDYLVPSGMVVLAKLPLTANGKLDRQALPSPEEFAARTRSFEPPQTPVEQTLAAIWEQVLRRTRIGRNDNFFDIGGHSLLATQIISRVRGAFKVEVPLQRLFDAPTVAALALQIEALDGPRAAAPPPIVPVPRDQDLPLSYAQQRLWVLDQLDPNNPLYNIVRAWRIEGCLSVSALERSLNHIVLRHESQRTTFAVRNGEPIQIIRACLNLPLEEVDITFVPSQEQASEVRRLASAAAAEPFHLERGPLLRARLYKLGSHAHVLSLTMHHIISDAWSAGVFFAELSQCYEAFAGNATPSLPELEIQFADYAVWQRNWLAGEVLNKELDYWRRQLAGAPSVLNLPMDRPRPAVRTFSGSYETIRLSSELGSALTGLSKQAGTTTFMSLLTIFGCLLARLSAADQVVIGTDVANRNRAELEHLIGFFINLLPLRVDLTGNPTFRELLSRLRETTLGAYAHQEVPFDKLVEDLRPDRGLNHNPIVQVLFVMQNVPRPPRELAGLEIDSFEIPVTSSKFDLAVFVQETSSGPLMHWLYSTELFDRESVRRMAGQFEALLNNAIANPDARLNSLALVRKEKGLEVESSRKQHKYAQLRKLISPQSEMGGTGE